MPHRVLGRETSIVDEETFAFLTEFELRKAIRLRYSVSVLAILPALEGDVEMTHPRRLAEQLASVVSGVLRDTDVIRLPTSSSTLHVLLVDAPLEHLTSVTRRVTDEVNRHLFEINGGRKAVRLNVGGACFPTTAGTVQELMTQACTRAKEGRQHHSPDI